MNNVNKNSIKNYIIENEWKNKKKKKTWNKATT